MNFIVLILILTVIADGVVILTYMNFRGFIVFDCGVRNDASCEEYSNEGFYLDVDSAEKVVWALQKLIKSIRDKTTDGR